MILVLSVILLGLIFEYINGFHDTANAIATVVATRVLLPRQAILMAAVCNLIGALMGTAVATTIGRGLVEMEGITLHTLLSALVAAVIWNLADLAAWAPIQFQPRPDRRPLRRGDRLGQRPVRRSPLVGRQPRHASCGGALAEGGPANDSLADLGADPGFRRDGAVVGCCCETGVPTRSTPFSAACNCSAPR